MYLHIGFYKLLFKNSEYRRNEGNKDYAQYDDRKIVFNEFDIPK